MSDHTLRGCRVLIAEDEYMLMIDLSRQLEAAGAVVVGPAGTLDDALALLHAHTPLDAAILDVNLHGQKVFAAAEMLLSRAIPFVFVTGYDEEVIPSRFAGIARCEKPIDVARVASALATAILSSV